jgi:hypothetical protein
MSVKVSEENDGKVLVIHVSDRLTKEDYAHLVPEVGRLIEKHGKIRMLFEMHDFHGWSCGALWEDAKFALHHFRDIERLAVIGEKKWQKGMATFCKPFTKAEIRYFDHSQAEEARTWLGIEMVVTR